MALIKEKGNWGSEGFGEGLGGVSALLRECGGLGFTKKLEAKPRSLHDNYQD